MMRFNNPIPKYGHVMTINDFKEAVDDGMFTDYDGHGYASNGKHESEYLIMPSRVDFLPKEVKEQATHVVWYNK